METTNKISKKGEKNDEPIPIVSSAHLADKKSWQLSELEFALIIAHNAFSKWIVRCMAAGGCIDFSALDVLVLHNVNHRKRSKKISDICFMLSIEDLHVVSYSLKKLEKANLVIRNKVGKEIFFRTSEEGEKICNRYKTVRENCLLATLEKPEEKLEEYRKAARTLRQISGDYDQAARVASSL